LTFSFRGSILFSNATQRGRKTSGKSGADKPVEGSTIRYTVDISGWETLGAPYCNGTAIFYGNNK